MGIKKLLIFLLCACVLMSGTTIVYAQEEIEVNTNAYEEPPQQGTFIPCEHCVILYPERYEEDPKSCPVCQGAKEHFQAARMMTREMEKMGLKEIDADIQKFINENKLETLEPLDIEKHKKLRKLYYSKLIYILVHDFIEVDQVKEKVLETDQTIEGAEEASKGGFKVVSVISGNTIALDDGRVIRLLGAAVPKLDEHARASKEFLRGLVEGKSVFIEYEETDDGAVLKDTDGVMIAYVRYLTKNYEGPEQGLRVAQFEGRVLSVKIIKEGYALADTRYPFDHMENYVLLEKSAKENQKGLWK